METTTLPIKLCLGISDYYLGYFYINNTTNHKLDVVIVNNLMVLSSDAVIRV